MPIHNITMHRKWLFSPRAMLLLPAPGSVLAGSSALFTWTMSMSANLYQLHVGSTFGAYDIGMFPIAGTTETSTLATGLPVDGRTLYIRVYTEIGGMWFYNDYIYTAAG